MSKEIPKELIEEAEKYALGVNCCKKDNHEFDCGCGGIEDGYVAGATSDYVEKQKEEFAIGFAKWLNNNFYLALTDKYGHYYVASTSKLFEKEYNEQIPYHLEQLLTKYKESL